jgi:hypothetical protein
LEVVHDKLNRKRFDKLPRKMSTYRRESSPREVSCILLLALYPGFAKRSLQDPFKRIVISNVPYSNPSMYTHFIKLYLSTRKVKVGPVGSLAILKCMLAASVRVKIIICVTPSG